MTVRAAACGEVDRNGVASLALIERSLRAASSSLRGDVSLAKVQAAERVIDRAERSLGRLAVDPWDPALRPVREAREILSSHLLAAAACVGADIAPPITASVLRRGADSACLSLLATHSTAGPNRPG